MIHFQHLTDVTNYLKTKLEMTETDRRLILYLEHTNKLQNERLFQIARLEQAIIKDYLKNHE